MLKKILGITYGPIGCNAKVTRSVCTQQVCSSGSYTRVRESSTYDSISGIKCATYYYCTCYGQ